VLKQDRAAEFVGRYSKWKTFAFSVVAFAIAYLPLFPPSPPYGPLTELYFTTLYPVTLIAGCITLAGGLGMLALFWRALREQPAVRISQGRLTAFGLFSQQSAELSAAESISPRRFGKVTVTFAGTQRVELSVFFYRHSE
jgi:hypothetical protein